MSKTMEITELIPTTIMTTLNGTGENPPSYIEQLKLANKIIQSSILAFIMIAMGCVITVEDIKTTVCM